MPAIPVIPKPDLHPFSSELAGAIAREGVFERGDKVYLVGGNLQKFTPDEKAMEEYAFSTQVKKTAPNENIVWFKGQYVEADKPNGNGAQWKAEELSIKSLTPMLMPVTVMHDPRTAVGTIADLKLLTPEADNVPRSRIETVLALWGHRFPDAVREAEVNAEHGTLMQSMECYSPWYECSECGRAFQKLPEGAEQANWCDHLKASNPNAGYVDLGLADGSSNASRILGDVCFTGTGLIFGTRGARGAYSEAHLEPFMDEVALYHHTVHAGSSSNPSQQRSATSMTLVQIEDSELATIRRERDEAKAEAAAKATEAETAKASLAETETKLTEVEAAKATAETAKQTAETELASEREKTAKVELKDTRMKALGGGFTAKLGDFTKERLEDKAQELSDEDWDVALKELEEAYAVKRDDADGSGDGGGNGGNGGGNNGGTAPDFSKQEIASFNGVGGGGDTKPPTETERQSVIGGLASAFKPTPAKTS